jgi:phosphate transport system substrate-binding protein
MVLVLGGAAIFWALFSGTSHSVRSPSSVETGRSGEKLRIQGAGATFPYPVYSKWISQYRTLSPKVEFEYQSIGSGAGIRQLQAQTVDFGASDAPMKDEQILAVDRGVLHVPTVLGAVVLTYHLPDLSAPVRLSGQVLGDIFLGKIKSWDDPALQSLQTPGVILPKLPILVIHRSDGSGTTSIFSDYLSKVHEVWKSQVGTGTALKWPTGLGGKGNEGVAALVKQARGAIGYVEFLYAEKNRMKTAEIQNRESMFVSADHESVRAAAQASYASIPDDFRVSITDAGGKASYPLAAFTYLLLYRTMPKEKRDAMVEFSRWALTEGQNGVAALGYSPLPPQLVKRVLLSLDRVTAE